jgi:hypothetical protein
MEPSVVDQIQLNFNSKGLLIVNAANSISTPRAC